MKCWRYIYIYTRVIMRDQRYAMQCWTDFDRLSPMQRVFWSLPTTKWAASFRAGERCLIVSIQHWHSHLPCITIILHYLSEVLILIRYNYIIESSRNFKLIKWFHIAFNSFNKQHKFKRTNLFHIYILSVMFNNIITEIIWLEDSGIG